MQDQTQTPGVRPDKAELVCSDCGYEYTCTHMNIAPFSRQRVECPDCGATGVVRHNRFSYVASTGGDVFLRGEGGR